MAPILNILIRLLPSLPGSSRSSVYTDDFKPSIDRVNQQQQQPIPLTVSKQDELPVKLSESSSLSSITWGKDRLDVFGRTSNRLSHKFWDGYQWNPSGQNLEILASGLRAPPVALTWGVNRLDIFGLGDDYVLKHQYWDGSGWRPIVAEFETLAGGCDSEFPIAANTWGPNRLDVFCTGPNGDLKHQYYDGSQWQPSVTELESLGGALKTGPSVVSWGKNRLDIFGLNPQGLVAHIYWEGSHWSDWEIVQQFYFAEDELTATTWGEGRLDVYGVAADNGTLQHIYWNGLDQPFGENLGGPNLVGSVAATSWSVNRHDIVGRSGDDNSYWYKYWDGGAWRPDVLGWYKKGPAGGPAFDSNPSVSSWGENRLDIYGVNQYNELLHQAWTGSSWYPSASDWETLASAIDSAEDQVRASEDHIDLRK